MDSTEKYCMKWNSYQRHIGSFLSKLCESESLADVTLWAENQKFYCHRVILSACSPYFQEILSSTVSKHPTVVLAGINAEDIKTIIHFIYNGELDNITYDRFISVLKTAEILKICGLTEVIEHIPPRKCLVDLEELMMMNDTSNAESSEQLQNVKFCKVQEDITSKKQKTKKHQRKYSEGSLSWALSDMEKGMSLVEAAKVHKIPRSTLYAKAKQHTGLRIASRKEHTNQDCQAAVQAVAGGMSLKRAAEQFGIPKTVLWRRVQKRLDICTSLKSRRKKQERNIKIESNHKNGLNEQQLKHNRLSDSSESINKIKTTDEDTNDDNFNKNTKQFRLAQALNACKEGKMSQAVASRTFQVPKTLIWRRLQKATEENQNSVTSDVESSEQTIQEDQPIIKDNSINYISVLSNVDNYESGNEKNDVKYVENSEHYTETPLIILTSSSDTLPKQEIINEEELIESLNVRIQNVVEVISDKEDVNWQ